jgi:hypothetical protein
MRMYGCLVMLFSAVLAAGCGGDNGFAQGNHDPTNQTGVGRAEFFPTEILFPSCNPTIAYSKPFKVTNVGDNTLTVYEISVIAGGPTFTFEAVAQFTLEPEEDREFQVVATLPDDQPADGTLRIKTSDAKALEFTMPLHADPAPADSGDSGV